MKGIVSIILLNYNGFNDTIECVNSIIKNKYEQFNIIIIDNNSSNESLYMLKKYCSTLKNFNYCYVTHNDKNRKYDFSSKLNSDRNIILIANDSNTGFSAGNNVGIFFCEKYLKTDYFWILNNDTTIDSMAIVNQLSCITDNTFVGSMIYDYNSTQLLQVAGALNYNKYLGKVKALNINNYKTSKFDFLSGASIFGFAKDFYELKGFDEDYFLYADDMDFCKKILRFNKNMSICSNSLVYHKGGSSIGTNKDIKQKTFFSEYHSNLSLFIFNKKWYPKIYKMLNFNRFVLKYLYLKIYNNNELINALIDAKKEFDKRK